MMAQAAPEKVANKAPSTGPLRLNLGGCGEGFLDGRIPGFKTVDLREGPGTDIVCNVRKLSPIGDSTADDIYASNVLEHFSHLDTVSVLQEWQRALKRGGKLYVSVPDFDFCVREYKRFGLTEWLNFHMFGDQKHELNYHYTIFTFATLAKALTDAGFSDVKRVKELGLIQDGSCNVSTGSGELISLNVIATK